MTDFYEEERAALEASFQTMWAARTQVKWENQLWQEPKEDINWCAFHINSGDGDKIEIGHPDSPSLHRYGGMVIVQVFQRTLTGTVEAGKLADAVSNHFRDKIVNLPNGGYIQFRTPRTSKPGTLNGWFQLNVFCPYSRNVFQ